jgi:NQR2/RnfD/RnfE family subunit of NADH-ubiquinone oxidoreductase
MPQRPRYTPPATHRVDPRWFQIGALSLLLGYGIFGLGFEISAAYIASILCAALITQWLATRMMRLPMFDPLSALISGIGLCTLLRTSHLLIAVAAASLAIASKFVIRWNGKHVFNPTNLALAALLGLGAPVWISPGQYGHLAFVALGIACAGSVVVNRAARSDVTFAFLGAWALVLFGRSLLLGEPATIPLHRLENGLLMQFAFFMISDPRTTPESRAGRIVFAVLVALGAAYVTFVHFRTNGLVWSLVACSTLVPVLDRLLPGARYEWNRVSRPGVHPQGATHEHGVEILAAGAVRDGAGTPAGAAFAAHRA